MKLQNPKALPVLVSAACMVIIGSAELALWWLSGYGPLLSLALLQLMAAGVNALLLLPGGKEYVLLAAPTPRDNEKKILYILRKLLTVLMNAPRQLANFWYQKKNGILGLALGAVIVAANLLFWPNAFTQYAFGLSYYQPVVLAVLFVLSVAMEKWCAYHMSAQKADSKSAILARNLREAFLVGRTAQVLTAVDLVLQLTGLFDSRLILQILLAVLFVYKTVMYVLSLAIRLIRRELSSQPLVPLSPKHMGASGILSYLEENTGITMRSLWSIRFIRQLLPSVALFAVLLVWLATGLVQIESHQQGALYRCGKLQDKTLKPGIHLTLPWPFDRVEICDTQSLRKVVVGYVPNEESTSDNVWTEGHGQEEYRLLLGGGNEMVSINLVVEYRISDLNQYLRRSANAESLLQAAAYEIVTERTIATDIDALLSADRTVFSETFQQELARRMEDQELGLEVAEVVLESIHPPVEVASTYQRVISAGIEAQQLILEAERVAVLEVAAAKQQADTHVSVENTCYHQEVAKAKGAVAAFMASVEAYNGYPEAFTYYKYISAITAAYKKGVLIIAGEGIDTGSLIIGDLSRPIPEVYNDVEPEVEEEYFE